MEVIITCFTLFPFAHSYSEFDLFLLQIWITEATCWKVCEMRVPRDNDFDIILAIKIEQILPMHERHALFEKLRVSFFRIVDEKRHVLENSFGIVIRRKCCFQPFIMRLHKRKRSRIFRAIKLRFNGEEEMAAIPEWKVALSEDFFIRIENFGIWLVQIVVSSKHESWNIVWKRFFKCCQQIVRLNNLLGSVSERVSHLWRAVDRLESRIISWVFDDWISVI